VSHVPLLTPTTVRSLIEAHDLHPSRALGQHYLADPNTARRIVRLSGVEAGDHVLEIGPGVGSLTLALVDAGAEVVALELDRRLVPVLDGVVGDRARVVVGDATTVDLEACIGELHASRPYRCVSNLPYNVATNVVVRLLETAPRIEHIFVMVQREVGERLAATPGGKEYGAVSVKVAYYATAEVVGTVPPTVFVPKPKVDSALVRLTRRDEPPVEVPSSQRLFELSRAGFAQRRKTLRRSLAPVLGDRAGEVLSNAGVDPSARAETLDLEQWAAVTRAAA